MEKYYYGYDEFSKDTQKLVDKCRGYEPDVLLAVARGGMTLSHLMSQALDMRNLYSLNSIHYEGTLKLNTINVFNIPDMSKSKRVLIIDDIVDSGETMEELFKILKEKFPKTENKQEKIRNHIPQKESQCGEEDDGIVQTISNCKEI